MRIEPMLLKRVNALPQGNNFIYERKWDGGRMIAYVKQGRVKIFTRQGNIVSHKFPEIADELAKLPDCILDGEIVVLKDDKSDFRAYQRRVMMENPFQIKLLAKTIPATYVIFDIIQLGDMDLKYYTLMERKETLDKLLGNGNTFIKPIIYYETPDFLLQKANSIEGIVAKRKDSVYESGKRSGAWVKYRFIKEAIVEAIDFEETPSGIVAIDEKGNRITINGKQAEDVKKAIIENGKIQIEINYMEKTIGGRYRFPSFKRMVIK
ncbi:MAG: hypothetical protein DRI61_15450 [Chloroflexi bacterium]|nr:MAG: hypothetical protein DRI61_15450 [Chloroflexota bacterium]